MNESVLTAQEGGGVVLVSFGSGDPASGGGRAGRRAQGRAGRQIAPAGAHRSLRGTANRLANTPGRGRARRRAILEEIDQAARRGRGGPRLTNAQVAEFRRRLAALR